MKIVYDPEVDAAYISFRKGEAQVTTIRLNEDIAVDLGPDEEIRGIEVLSASRHLGPLKAGERPVIELENVDLVKP
jgi:uncharacterized protein YuzE